jgi:hypothetical protein
MGEKTLKIDIDQKCQEKQQSKEQMNKENEENAVKNYYHKIEKIKGSRKR